MSSDSLSEVDDEMNNPCRWSGYAALSAYDGNEQTAFACIRQADDLLSSFHAHAGGY